MIDGRSSDPADAPTLSVVIPTFNEAARIEHTLRTADEYRRSRDLSCEIIVVDNGSTDGTAALIVDLDRRGVCATRLINEHCRGKGAAVRRGVLESRGRFVVFMDADAATPLSEVERFWPWWDKGYDVVIGSRYVDASVVEVPQHPMRIALSRVGNVLIQALVVPGIKDTQLGFKGFTAAAAKDLFGALSSDAWAFDVELLARARRRGYRIREVPVSWREPGGSHLPATAYLTTLLDVLKIRWRLWRER